LFTLICGYIATMGEVDPVALAGLHLPCCARIITVRGHPGGGSMAACSHEIACTLMGLALLLALVWMAVGAAHWYSERRQRRLSDKYHK
jgi:hypothetical protein